MKVAIIGGGAAGFFAAINTKTHYPEAEVRIFEKTSKLLSKVKISGGGRCNVTNGEESIKKLSLAFPRGASLLKKLFQEFSTVHTKHWFESRDVPLMTQDDNCVFPVSQDSQSIIDCFLNECKKLKIDIHLKHPVIALRQDNGKITLAFKSKDQPVQSFDKVILATGGSPKRINLEWLEQIDHLLEDPVPSLFTFNMPDESIKSLMGIVVEETLVKIQGTKLKADGPLLITHWGMSGPAILKLSAFGARILSDLNYQFQINVNWIAQQNQELVKRDLIQIMEKQKQKKLSNFRAYDLPTRLWLFFLTKARLPHDKRWGELGKKGIDKLVNVLTHDQYSVSGKTTFKEEFVTCGGISLSSINLKTMESKNFPNLYFAGEVLDIDGITGGYNFQSCWTTGFIASKLMHEPS